MIKAVNLCYTYQKNAPGEVNAVNNINLTLEPGDSLGIIGKTGSGKSTLAQILCGLIKPTSGSVFLGNKNIYKDFKNMQDVYFKIGMVFQYPETQIFEKTVFEDIAFGPRARDLSDNEISKRVHDAANFVGLSSSLFSRFPAALSGGESRKCAIAGVIANEPEVLILDEPTSGLDPAGRKNLMRSLKKYHKQKNGIMIFISHVMEETAEIANKILVMDNGCRAFFGTPENVFKNDAALSKIGLDTTETHKIISFVNNRKKIFPDNIINPSQAKKFLGSILSKEGDKL